MESLRKIEKIKTIKKANDFVFLILRVIFIPVLYLLYRFKFDKATSKNVKSPCKNRSHAPQIPQQLFDEQNSAAPRLIFPLPRLSVTRLVVSLFLRKNDMAALNKFYQYLPSVVINNSLNYTDRSVSILQITTDLASK